MARNLGRDHLVEDHHLHVLDLEVVRCRLLSTAAVVVVERVSVVVQSQRCQHAIFVVASLEHSHCTFMRKLV